ncbi:hypothetical protein [Ilumatobacter sp.]|uniref:hypothetical protein n=1 Tax=Ilumatobacter sp. TaxID=1967498 RepID=UPI003B528DB3
MDTAVDCALGRTPSGSVQLVIAAVRSTLLAAGFVAAATAVWVDANRSTTAVTAIALVSLVACVIALPDTMIGLIVNDALPVAMGRIVGRRRGRQP